MRTLLGTYHRVKSVDVMSCSRAQRRTINHWTIFIYMKRCEKRSEKTGTCLLLPVSFPRNPAEGWAEIRFIVVQASAVWSAGEIDPEFREKENGERARIALPRQGLSLKRAYLPEGGGNVVFQIIVMIFLATLEFDICRCPACGDKDWLTEKEATLFVD